MDLYLSPVEAAPEEEGIKARRSRAKNPHLRRLQRSRGTDSGGASMEIGMRPVKAAPEREWTEAEVRERALPVDDGWYERYAVIVAQREADHERMKNIWLPEEGEDVEDDFFADEASRFRDSWNQLYSPYYGCFEDTTKIRNKRFTYRKPHDYACTLPTLQVFALKIAKLRAPLQWPLQVFGIVAIRDCVDHNRNIIFDRPRDACQIITQEDPYLKLTGPTRAVVALDPATFEVDLKVKGTTESEDQWLSFLAVTYHHFPRLDSHLLERDYASKLSELLFQLGSIVQSVEATIEVRIIRGSWPHCLHAQFTAGTASIPGAEVILLDSGDHDEPVFGGYRNLVLSRCVASVEDGGKLWVRVKAILDDEVVVDKVMHFESKKESVSNGSLRVDFDGEISKAKTAGKGEISISKAETAGEGRPPGFFGSCTLHFNISWSLISYTEVRN